MKPSFNSTLISVWRPGLVEDSEAVNLGTELHPVTRSRAKRHRQVAPVFDGNTIVGIEQNPKTKSRWVAMARAGKKVRRYIQDGGYIAVVADGTATVYGKRDTSDKSD